MSPPGGEAPATSNSSLTDLSAPRRPRRNRTRSDRAKARDRMTRTPVHRRFKRLMESAGMVPEAWQVESLVATTIANRDESEEDRNRREHEELMRAPWFPKTRRQHWKVGQGGGWAVRS